MAPLNIMLGLILQFMKLLDTESTALKHLEAVFSKLHARNIRWVLNYNTNAEQGVVWNVVNTRATFMVWLHTCC